jgi:hypothetical protein
VRGSVKFFFSSRGREGEKERRERMEKSGGGGRIKTREISREHTHKLNFITGKKAVKKGKEPHPAGPAAAHRIFTSVARKPPC